MKRWMFLILSASLCFYSCATFHPVSSSVQSEKEGVTVTTMTLVMTPIVQTGRTGAGSGHEVVTAVKAPENHIWGMLAVEVKSGKVKDATYDLDKIVLITGDSKVIYPSYARYNVNPSAVASPSMQEGIMLPFLFPIKNRTEKYYLFYDIDLQNTPVFLKIESSEPVKLNIPPEDFVNKAIIIPA